MSTESVSLSEAASDAVVELPDGLLIHLDEKSRPRVSVIGTGLPEFSVPTLLRKVAKAYEESLLQ